MRKSILFVLSLAVITSCQPDLTKDFSFLEGSWKMVTSDSSYLLEKWEKVDDNNYAALNYVISDSLGMQLSEEIKIQITDSGTYYMPTIIGLNDGDPFKYNFISQENNKYVFENELYEFPRRIWYKVIDENNMQAGIESESGDKKETFIFEKVQN